MSATVAAAVKAAIVILSNGYPFPADRSGGSALRHPLRNLTAQCVRRGAVLPRRLHFRQRHAGVPKIHRGYAEQL